MERFEACAVNVDMKHSESFEKAVEVMKKAVGEDCDLFVFPELLVDFTLVEDAEDALNRVVGEVRGKNIVFGAKWPENGKIYNRAFFISENGDVVFYDKVHLTSGEEKKGYTPGNKLKVFDTPFGKMGIAICFDLLFPEVFRTLARKGAEFVVLPALWPVFDRMGWEIFTIARARENQIFGIYSSGTGKYAGILRIGGSRIISPLGEIVANAGPDPRAYSIARAVLEPEMLEWAKGKGWKKQDYMSKLRPEVYELF